MTAPSPLTSQSVSCRRPQGPHLPQPHPLPLSPYCIVKKSSTTPLSTRKEIYKREIKYSLPLLRSLSLVTDPPSSSQFGMGGLNAPFLIFPISVSLRNCKIAPVTFSSLNNSDIFLFLRCFYLSFLPMVVHTTLISVFHLPHSLKRWSLVCRLPVSHHQHWSKSVFFSLS